MSFSLSQAKIKDSFIAKAHKYCKYITWFLFDVYRFNAFPISMFLVIRVQRKNYTRNSNYLSSNFSNRKRIGRLFKKPTQQKLTPIQTKTGQFNCIQCKKDRKNVSGGNVI